MEGSKEHVDIGMPATSLETSSKFNSSFCKSLYQ